MNYDDYFIGDPAAQMDNWIYQDADNCAVAAETSIINQFLPSDLTLDEAGYISRANGWWQPGMGTSPDEIGNLMDVYGISNHTVFGASLEQLVSELQMGHGVIVGINSAEVWDQGICNQIKQFFYEAFGLDTADFNPADHAVVVTGVDLSDPGNPMVIINDSGIPNGAAVRYPLDKFVDAWENSGFYYTSTSVPIPESKFPAPNDLGFDLATFLDLAITVIKDYPSSGELVHQISDADWENIIQSI